MWHESHQVSREVPTHPRKAFTSWMKEREGAPIPEVGGNGRHRVPSTGEAQGGADQGMEGAFELAVGHARAAEGHAADVCVRVLYRSPCRACITTCQPSASTSPMT